MIKPHPMNKLILISAFLCIGLGVSASDASPLMTPVEQPSQSFLPGKDKKGKKHRKATYGRKKSSKGTSCKGARKIMKRRGNW